jgi:DNA-binding transcriptional regulator GbsR (MarR family)
MEIDKRGVVMGVKLKDEERTLVEEVGIVFENTGLPRMAGRMFGWLLISEPPYQSPAELADVLMASKGSISTTVRLLAQLGFIERYVIPGERHDHFRLREDALKRTVKRGIEDEIKMFRELAERGLELMKDESPEKLQWLKQMRDRYAFLEKTFPVMMERYDRKRARLQMKLELKNK